MPSYYIWDAVFGLCSSLCATVIVICFLRARGCLLAQVRDGCHRGIGHPRRSKLLWFTFFAGLLLGFSLFLYIRNIIALHDIMRGLSRDGQQESTRHDVCQTFTVIAYVSGGTGALVAIWFGASRYPELQDLRMIISFRRSRRQPSYPRAQWGPRVWGCIPTPRSGASPAAYQPRRPQPPRPSPPTAPPARPHGFPHAIELQELRRNGTEISRSDRSSHRSYEGVNSIQAFTLGITEDAPAPRRRARNFPDQRRRDSDVDVNRETQSSQSASEPSLEPDEDSHSRSQSPEELRVLSPRPFDPEDLDSHEAEEKSMRTCSSCSKTRTRAIPQTTRAAVREPLTPTSPTQRRSEDNSAGEGPSNFMTNARNVLDSRDHVDENEDDLDGNLGLLVHADGVPEQEVNGRDEEDQDSHSKLPESQPLLSSRCTEREPANSVDIAREQGTRFAASQTTPDTLPSSPNGSIGRSSNVPNTAPRSPCARLHPDPQRVMANPQLVDFASNERPNLLRISSPRLIIPTAQGEAQGEGSSSRSGSPVIEEAWSLEGSFGSSAAQDMGVPAGEEEGDNSTSRSGTTERAEPSDATAARNANGRVQNEDFQSTHLIENGCEGIAESETASNASIAQDELSQTTADAPSVLGGDPRGSNFPLARTRSIMSRDRINILRWLV